MNTRWRIESDLKFTGFINFLFVRWPAGGGIRFFHSTAHDGLFVMRGQAEDRP